MNAGRDWLRIRSNGEPVAARARTGGAKDGRFDSDLWQRSLRAAASHDRGKTRNRRKSHCLDSVVPRIGKMIPQIQKTRRWMISICGFSESAGRKIRRFPRRSSKSGNRRRCHASGSMRHGAAASRWRYQSARPWARRTLLTVACDSNQITPGVRFRRSPRLASARRPLFSPPFNSPEPIRKHT